MTPEEARELRHELRTPVNHLIGYAELLLEEDEADEADIEALEAVRARAREVLELVPGLLGDGTDGTDGADASAGSVTALVDRVAQLESLTAGLAATSSLPAADIERLSVAAARLGSLAGRLTDGPLLVQRDAGDAAAPMPGRLETVLVVDDDEANRNVLGRRLAKLGYGIVEARDGVEALERLAQPDAGIDLVLLDVMMPRLDGFAVLERHRADPSIRHIPVIMISALDDMASIVRCIEAGAEDYLPKPFDPVLLKARVAACMEKKRLRDAERDLLAQVAAWNAELEQRVAEQVQEVERFSVMRRFVPPQLVDVLAAGGAAMLQSHRAEITVLFCDLRGFTSFAERSEPEDVMAVLREMHDAVGPVIFEQGGTLSQFTGDGMMVFFNDPIPCVGPERRAVILGLAMRDRTERLAEEWKRRGHDLRLGVGIATGYATCGQIGFEGRFEYTAIGTVVNLAARLCGQAQGGEVLAAERVVAALGDSVVSEPAGEIELKGMARPVAIHRVEALT
ncbi:MAG: response regulator [Actinobacteria bacterium]|nr:response regulator [Actinomycetota bacterium]